MADIGSMDIHVLATGELFSYILSAMAAFVNNANFTGLVRIAALVGIIMATVAFIKKRDPMVFGYWLLAYLIFSTFMLSDKLKTTVCIKEISGKTFTVANVPLVFAIPANIITSIGYGLAESYDMHLSMPDDLLYTKTGALFGSRLIQAASSFKITDPILKEEMNQYFRSCVVGDIRLNNKYSVGDLGNSVNLWALISTKASPLRMTSVNGKLVSCLEASGFDATKADGSYSLKKKLDAEIKKSYAFFGVHLFPKVKKSKATGTEAKPQPEPEKNEYESLFQTHLKSAFEYYQGLTDASSNIFLQSMMINAMREGVGNYQAFTDSTAGIVNQQFSKSQTQQRWSWQMFGMTALWFLPLLHTCLTLLLFGVFPLVLILTILPGGLRIVGSYLQFFFSLQLWPVMFAILNTGMSIYGSAQSGEYGQFTMVNLNKIDELHNDISGVCGYMMMLIPYLANGLVSNLGAAFSHLSGSTTGQLQSSTMSVAGEAASASFGLGQTSFYNTSANNLSANKHDSNFTNMHGMHTDQMASGVLKTLTGSGDAVFDVSPGMTRSGIHITDAKALSGSMNQAYEESKQAAQNSSVNAQKSLSNFAHKALQLSHLKGHDLRLGNGVSENESGQYQKALATMSHIASDVAKRRGISEEDALTLMAAGSLNVHAGMSSDKSAIGWLAKFSVGWQAGGDVNAKLEGSKNSSSRHHIGTDSSISAREAHDFNEALNYVNNFTKNHHFDDTHSQAASLSNQIGADLRDTETAGRNYDASMSQAARIHNAKSYVESKSDQITADLNQAFPGYVASRVGENERDKLFSSPGNMAAIEKLEGLASDFIANKRDSLIAQYGNDGKSAEIDAFYAKVSKPLLNKEADMVASFKQNSTELNRSGKEQGLGINVKEAEDFQQKIHGQIAHSSKNLDTEGEFLQNIKDEKIAMGLKDIRQGKIIN